MWNLDHHDNRTLFSQGEGKEETYSPQIEMCLCLWKLSGYTFAPMLSHVSSVVCRLGIGQHMLQLVLTVLWFGEG
jgi:hypothetical protein